MRVAQAFVHESETAARFHALGQNYFDSRIAAQRLVAVYFPFVQFLSAVADAIVLGAGADLIAHGHLTTGTLIAFILYIDMFFSPIQQLSQVFDAWQQTTVSVSRISDLMQLDTLTPEADEPVAARRLRGQLTLDNVRFSYRPSPLQARRRRRSIEQARPQGRPRLACCRRTSAKAPPSDPRHRPAHRRRGDRCPGGRDRSRQVNFYETPGSLLRPRLRRCTSRRTRPAHPRPPRLPLPTRLRAARSIPLQRRVRDNIAYGRPDATDADIERAARAVGAHDFVAALPGGYLHELSERGRSLSAGQRQLLALARAELVDPAILLLDEATSNLDLATEARLAAAMDQVSNGRTTIVIAHRLQTARAADRIVVLHAGTIAESGTHDELRARGGRYAAMWDAFETVNRDGPPNGVSGLTRGREPGGKGWRLMTTTLNDVAKKKQAEQQAAVELVRMARAQGRRSARGVQRWVGHPTNSPAARANIGVRSAPLISPHGRSPVSAVRSAPARARSGFDPKKSTSMSDDGLHYAQSR